MLGNDAQEPGVAVQEGGGPPLAQATGGVTPAAHEASNLAETFYNTNQLVDVAADPRAACHAADGRCWQLMRASVAKNALLSGHFSADMLCHEGVQCAQVGDNSCVGFSCAPHYFTDTQTKKAEQRGIGLTTPAPYQSLSNTEMFLQQEDAGWHVGRSLTLALPQGDTNARKTGNCVRIPVQMPQMEQSFPVGASVEQQLVAGAAGTLMTELVAGSDAVYVLIPYGPTKFKERILKPLAPPARSSSPTPADLEPQYE